MGVREDRIDREIRAERREIGRLTRQIRKDKRLLDQCKASGLVVMADSFETKINLNREKVERERAKIEGKQEIKDDGGVQGETAQLIEQEEAALDRKRAERDRLERLPRRTPAQEARLRQLNQEILRDGWKIEGKEIAGRAAGEYAMRDFPGDCDGGSGEYRFALLDQLGREVFSIRLPGGGIGAPALMFPGGIVSGIHSSADIHALATQAAFTAEEWDRFSEKSSSKAPTKAKRRATKKRR